MTQGFAVPSDDIKIQVIIKRLNPAAQRKDEQAFSKGLREATERYGRSVAEQAVLQLMDQHEWLRTYFLRYLNPNQLETIVQEQGISATLSQLKQTVNRLALEAQIEEEHQRSVKLELDALTETLNQAEYIGQFLDRGLAPNFQGYYPD